MMEGSQKDQQCPVILQPLEQHVPGILCSSIPSVKCADAGLHKVDQDEANTSFVHRTTSNLPGPANGTDELASQCWLRERRAFLVLGAMKCGTCALRQHLHDTSWSWEDRLSMAWDELHFFDNDESFAKGASHYAQHFKQPHWRNEVRYIGEITPSYLYVPEAIARIKGLLPHAKLIVMLRNPIDRALSQQNHDLRKQRQKPPLLARCLEDINRRKQGQRASLSDVFARGLYHEQLQRLLKHFPRDQIKVVISERYRKDPFAELCEIRNFLGLTITAPMPLEEKHVGKYVELLSVQERATLCDMYADDVSALKSLLDDTLPEWTDFQAISTTLVRSK
jgi:hypothetical protein